MQYRIMVLRKRHNRCGLAGRELPPDEGCTTMGGTRRQNCYMKIKACFEILNDGRFTPLKFRCAGCCHIVTLSQRFG